MRKKKSVVLRGAGTSTEQIQSLFTTKPLVMPNWYIVPGGGWAIDGILISYTDSKSARIALTMVALLGELTYCNK